MTLWMVWEGLLTLLAVLGLVLLGWVLFGRMVCPVPGRELVVVLPAKDNGGTLERDVRGLMWLRSLGLLRCPVVIADMGLTPEGVRLAHLLAERWSVVSVVLAEQMYF
jgi:hypothetical protein